MAKRKGKITDTFTSKPVRQQDSKEAKKKNKNSYYLPMTLVDEMEIAKIKLRSILGKNVTKSDLIEASLVLALEEFEEQGGGSRLASLLASM